MLIGTMKILKIYLKYLLQKFFKIKVNVLIWTSVLTVIAILLTCSNKKFIDSSNRPVIVWWTSGFPGTSEKRVCSKGLVCDIEANTSNLDKDVEIGAYLFYGSNIEFNNLPLPRRPNEIFWGLYHEESPRNVEELLHEPVLKLFNFSSTFSRFSDVPCTLQYLNSLEDLTSLTYFVETVAKNDHLKEIAPILYIQSDCETSSERDEYVKELMKVIKVDSYGACLNNKEMPQRFKEDYLNNLDDAEFLKFIARYNFVIAIENGVCDDYITEKLWRALKIGSVPIYFGSLSIRDWLPNNNSAVLLQDFRSVEELKNHIDVLLKDDSKYEEYLQHKLRQKVDNSKLLHEFKTRPWCVDAIETANQFECYICDKLYEKRKGNGVKYVVTKEHYNCPKPISALSLAVNPANSWVFSWETARQKAEYLYRTIIK